MDTTKKYSDILREKMKTKDNSQGHPITIRDLHRNLGYSYEHFRRLISEGQPSISRDLSDALSKYVGLDAEQMWSILVREKFKRRVSHMPAQYAPPANTLLKELWPKLSPADIDRVIKIVVGMAEANELSGIATPRSSRR